VVIYLGSTRPAKVDGASDAIRAIAAIDARFGAADVRPTALGEVGPPMPMTRAEIIDGARLRARAIVDRFDLGGGFAVGLEGGLDPIDGAESRPDGASVVLATWACVTDGRRWSYGSGGAVGVPAAIVRAVRAGRELGDVIDERSGRPVRGLGGAWGVLTRDLVGRREAFRLAVLAAFAPFFNPEVYGPIPSDDSRRAARTG
jgi:inosine/xanthosine triphosphatase